MNTTLSGYLLSTAFMLIILGILAIRTCIAISQKNSRNRCLLLLGTTSMYILMDAAFIICHFSEKMATSTWDAVAFLFYIIYVLLPFVWYLFVRNFVGTTFRPFIRKLEWIPLIVLLAMVLVTPFTNLLWKVTPGGVYERGSGFMIFSILNYFYYIAPLIDIVIILCNKNIKNEPYIFLAIFISLVPLIGAIINVAVIPVGTVFPFQPFCSIVVALLGFCFIASKDSDSLKDQQQVAVQLALTKAEAASRVKTRFLSDMSHDIRTPMNAISNLTELALEESDPKIIRSYLEKMDISGKFLLGLINDILDMSRIENGDFTLHKENLTRTEFLKTVETVVLPLIEKKNIHFHPELRPGEYTINVDKLRFNQIFFNLLSNAVKYTPDGGDVWFEVENMETANGILKIKFVVRDNGIGMSEEFLQHLYEPFAREETDFNIKTQGTGLGLSIVKKLVDAMNGTISVKSKLGEGTEFTVIFDADIVARVEIEKPVEKHDDDFSLEGLRVMLVEDNEMNTYVEKILLEKVGCIVTTVENGKKAVDLFNTKEPYSFDAILMDLRMPVMGGLEATKAIRFSERPDANSIPIIAMTADVFENASMETMEAGMNSHLSKPLDAEKLYKTLKELTPPPTYTVLKKISWQKSVAGQEKETPPE